jgi:hypothetical protein
MPPKRLFSETATCRFGPPGSTDITRAAWRGKELFLKNTTWPTAYPLSQNIKYLNYLESISKNDFDRI